MEPWAWMVEAVVAGLTELEKGSEGKLSPAWAAVTGLLSAVGSGRLAW